MKKTSKKELNKILSAMILLSFLALVVQTSIMNVQSNEAKHCYLDQEPPITTHKAIGLGFEGGLLSLSGPESFDSRAASTRAEELEKTNDWVITGEETIEDKTVIVKGNITIENYGTLTLKNVDLKMDTANKPLLVNITDEGNLLMFNSSLSIYTSMSEPHHSFRVKVYGNCVIDDCDLNYIGHKTINVAEQEDVGGCSSSSALLYDIPWDGYGLEIFTDNVTVSNSRIRYGNTGVTCFASSPKIYNNTFSDNYYGIICKSASPEIYGNNISLNMVGLFCNDSNFKLDYNQFSLNGYGIGYGILCEYSNLTLDSSFFFENEVGIYSSFSNLSCKNLHITDNYQGIYFFASDLFLKNCSIQDNQYGLDGWASSLNMNLSELEKNMIGIRANDISGTLYENIFTNSTLSGINAYDSELTIYDCSFNGNYNEDEYYGYSDGLFGVESEIIVYNCSFQDYWVGIVATGSICVIFNNVVFNNYAGFYVANNQVFEVYDNYVFDNYFGIIAGDTDLFAHDNFITGNQVGISYSNSTVAGYEFVILNNVIANNTEWGILALNYQPDISNNEFVDENGNPNGLGILLQEYTITVFVNDLYNNPISYAEVTIKDKNGNLVITGHTTQNGELETQNLTYSKILNDHSEVIYTPYTVSAKWGSSDWGHVSTHTTLEIHEFLNITIILNLPDFSISVEDITISKTNPEHDDKITIEAVVNYRGGMTVSNITVVFTADGLIIDEVELSSISDSESQKVSTEWKVAAYYDQTVKINVRVDVPWGLEYHRNMYLENNSAYKEIEAKGRPDEQVGIVLYPEQCKIISIILFIIILLLIIIIPLWVRKKLRAKKEEQAEKEEKEVRKPVPSTRYQRDRTLPSRPPTHPPFQQQPRSMQRPPLRPGPPRR